MAQSSEMRFGSKDPRICCICQKPVRITGDRSLGFYHTAKLNLAWHSDCVEPGWPHLKAAG